MTSAYLETYLAVKPAQIEWRGSLPFSLEFQDVYFSDAGALQESKHVFIQGNQLENDWCKKPQQNFSICELGFGSGLNFFTTAQHWQQHISSRSNKAVHLSYIAIEKRPFLRRDFDRCRKIWPEYRVYSDILAKNYPSPIFGRYQFYFPEINLTLTLMQMPVLSALNDLINENSNRDKPIEIDHWYLDGFTPKNNESMWQLENAYKIAQLSKNNSRIATYSVAAAVRSPLIQAGFKLQKTAGFGRKREMLTGFFIGSKNTPKTKQTAFINNRPTINIKFEKPWFNWASLKAKSAKKQTKIAIIGSGIAGCSTAYSLAMQGYHCQIFESSERICAAASDASCGIYHPSLTSDMNLASQFSWHAYQTFVQFLNQHHKSMPNIKLAHGLLRLQSSDKINKVLLLASKLNLTEAILSGTVANSIYYPHAGALDIQKYCRWLIEQIPKTQCHISLGHQVMQVKPHKPANSSFPWQLMVKNKVHVESHSFDHVIYCGGAVSDKKQSIISTLFLQNRESINGQINDNHQTSGQSCFFHSPQLAQKMTQLICEKIYLLPLAEQNFILGASFDSQTTNDLNTETQLHLFQQLNQLLLRQGITPLSQETIAKFPLQGQRARRLHTQDRLPLVGPVSDVEKIQQDFTQLGQTRLYQKNMRFYNQPGLWLNTAYGSHGLLYSLCASQHLSSLISGSVSPIPHHLSNAIHPARFLIRRLKKHKN